MSESNNARPAETATGRAGRAFLGGLRIIAGLLILIMMAVTFVDVIGRYVFSSPLPGAFELTEVLLGLVIFAGLPLVTLREEHVTVDLVTSRVPNFIRQWLLKFAHVVTAAVLIVLAWRLGIIARDLSAYGDATVFLRLPLGPVAGIMAALCAFGAAASLVVFFRR
ncbi:TRAP transporter small permease subunit [Stappia sp. GBMRC 2046]|uniref:TRAP transporter small permease protein n=1 Tax=Stappia sediminis TaxID=2692190 RepID=A0A7X3S874_9HYPH|nr:TRAP transporter small permease [Stappia sediminis]MXN65474.1 TRAP transporter small permease subunit [Stappia sediminis]